MKKYLALLLLLSACATPQQVAEQQRLQNQADWNTCYSYGFKPGSETFGNCRMQIDLERQRELNDYYNRPRYNAGFGYYHFR